MFKYNVDKKTEENNTLTNNTLPYLSKLINNFSKFNSTHTTYYKKLI